MSAEKFWENLALEDMNPEQWESLCDGCGRCCAIKLQDAESGKVFYTRAACQLLDTQSCRCSDYANRAHRVPDCAVLTPASARTFDWLPESCAYRRLANGKSLNSWHPLVSGDPESVHRAGISVRGQVISELDVNPDDFQDMLVDWDREPDNEQA